MDDNSRQMEGTELLLQVGLSGRVVPLQGIMDTMTVLDIKQQARNEVAQLLGKEFLSTELMCLRLGIVEMVIYNRNSRRFWNFMLMLFFLELLIG